MDRITRLLGTADRTQQILEVGAGYSPVAPKSGGWRTHVVDHAPRDELREKYASAGVDTNLIEDVDTVWRAGPLDEAVPPGLLNSVDLMIASHVLEHIPDLIGFLQSASRLVGQGGALSVALPDRRYCFDCFRPWTTTGGLLEAHHRRMRHHSLKTAFDHMAYSASSDGQIAWGPRLVGAPVLLDPFAVPAETVRSFVDPPDAPYQDYHAWQFTPAGFRLVMLELAALGLSDWQVAVLDAPENFEFFAVLHRSGGQRFDPTHLQAERRDLLLAQLAETREQVDFIFGSAGPAHAHPSEGYRLLLDRLSEQDRRLREMSETLGWMRTALRPVRRVWRMVRGKGEA